MEKDQARRILSDVSSECCFWVNNGPVVKNLEELYKALLKMKKETFKHHVNNEKNDFSNWIADILGDKQFADDLRKVKSRQDMAKKISQRIQALKKAAA